MFSASNSLEHCYNPLYGCQDYPIQADSRQRGVVFANGKGGARRMSATPRVMIMRFMAGLLSWFCVARPPRQPAPTQPATARYSIG